MILGLVLQDEFVIRQRAPQFTDNGEPVRVVLIMLGAVTHDSDVAELGDVHRNVRALKQRLTIEPG